MEITEKEIKHLASLSRLNFTDEELAKFSADFKAILDYVNELQKVDTSNVKDNTMIRAYDELREDEVKPSLSNEEIVGNAPKNYNGYFIAPTVVE